jgi:hypothetical protein
MGIIFNLSDRLTADTTNIVTLELATSKIQINLTIESCGISRAEELVYLKDLVHTHEMFGAHIAMDPIIFLLTLESR